MTEEITAGKAFCDSGLWLDLHFAATYYSSAERQSLLLGRIRSALASGDYEPALREMAPTPESARKVAGFTALRNRPQWHELVGKYLEALKAGLERELARRSGIRVPGDVGERVRKTFSGLSFFDPGDILEMPDPAGSPVYINYISRRFSPRHDGKEGAWDRDTQFKIELVFASGLFVWLSANVSPEFRGKGMGTELVLKCEEMAAGMGFRRLSVPGPNMKFWKKFGYAVDPRQVVVIDPSHNPNLEGYKEA